MQNKFSVRSFLKKEKNKGTNLEHIERRTSFLKFLKYTQEPKTLDDIIFDSERDESLHNSNNVLKVSMQLICLQNHLLNSHFCIADFHY